MNPNFPSIIFMSGFLLSAATNAATVRIPDTGQDRCYNNSRAISCPGAGAQFFGQDAQYQGLPPAYRDNGDGTITDLNTGLMWSKAVSPNKLVLKEAQRKAAGMTLGGYSDWRVPNIKELYSLIDFRGYTGFSGRRNLYGVPSNAIPYINTDYFDFLYGNTSERYIDAQWLSSTRYVSTTMGGMETLFGVNFADGRIKGYGYKHPRGRILKTFYVRYVRGEPYGQNQFQDNGDGTVTDHATGLTWAKMDSGRGMSWNEALDYAEKLNLAGHHDWRLPNAKELQYLVDYTRSPDTTGSAAIDPIFQASAIVNEKGEKDYPFYWTSTTHLDGPRPGSNGVYIAFGRAIGQMRGQTMDVHGAGAQRSDPKTGGAMLGHGPQGDAVRVQNYVRVVRGGEVQQTSANNNSDHGAYPYNVNSLLTQPEGEGSNYGQRRNIRQNSWGNNGQMQGENNNRMLPPGGSGQRRQSNSGGRFVERLDKDGDGRVSRSEFDGPADRFDDHDTNGDGYISEEEIANHPPPPNGGFGSGMR